MSRKDEIEGCYKSAKNYPDLAKKLNQIGIESYTVDTATSSILYRMKDGETLLHPSSALRQIKLEFDAEKTLLAVRNNQQGKTDYLGFMQEIADAGVRFYEATLCGSNPRVTFIGSGGLYEEKIPW